MYAIGVCMLANTVTVAFGAIGVSMIVAHQVTGIDLMSISKIVGMLLPLLSFIIPFWRCDMMAGWKRTAAVLPGILVAGLIFAITHFECLILLVGILPDILASMLIIVVLLMLLFVQLLTVYRYTL